MVYSAYGFRGRESKWWESKGEQEAGKSQITRTQGAEREKLGCAVRLRVSLKLYTSSSQTPSHKGPTNSSSSATGEVGAT